MQLLRHDTAMNDDPNDRRTQFDEFDAFLSRVEPKLRSALVATYGTVDGREALGDAMSWAWEHFETVRRMDHPIGYLYRVGQTATRRTRIRPIPAPPEQLARGPDEQPMSPHLAAAVNRLPDQQRRVVMLVNAFGWSQRDVAQLLGVSPSSVKQALERGIDRLVAELTDHQTTANKDGNEHD